MIWILRILAFLAINIIGFFSISLLFHMGQNLGVFSFEETSLNVQLFYTQSMFAWGLGAVLSIGFFIAKTALRYLFLMAPLLITIGYGFKFMFWAA